MLLFSTKEDYKNKFREELKTIGRESTKICEYVEFQFDQLEKVLDGMSKETFWIQLPIILGIDAKIILTIELLSFEDFSSDEIIRIVENDYRSYFKELCGYDLSMDTKHSIVFNVL